MIVRTAPGRPVAVVIDGDPWAQAECAARIASLGWEGRTCSGPGFERCPLEDLDTPCSIVADADVVAVSASHPAFAELLQLYGQEMPGVGIVAIEPPGNGLRDDFRAAVDAVATEDDDVSLAGAIEEAAAAGVRRAVDLMIKRR